MAIYSVFFKHPVRDNDRPLRIKRSSRMNLMSLAVNDLELAGSLKRSQYGSCRPSAAVHSVKNGQCNKDFIGNVIVVVGSLTFDYTGKKSEVI